MAPSRLPWTTAPGPTPTRWRWAIFNGDGKLDLVVANDGSNNVSILLGNGDGTFRAAVNYGVGSGSAPTSVAVGDFNGDGKLDLAVANELSNNVSILLGNGNGTFQAAVN
jgi:streptogramin lyase